MAASPFLNPAPPVARARPRPASRPGSGAGDPDRAQPIEVLVALLVGAALLAGWRLREEEYLTAASGLGYALGIMGTAAMLLLLLYPLRKRVRVMRTWGAASHWFRLHMLLGILGPALILFHANFQARSLNSTVAVGAMLLVATSGFVGRYLYSKIHYGLYGRRLTLAELKASLEDDAKDDTAFLHAHAPELRRRVLAFDAGMLAPPASLLHGLWRFLTAGTRTRRARRALLRDLERALDAAARAEQWSPADRRRRRAAARRSIAAHLGAARRVARFGFYERLFAMWHLLHTPLFLMLLVTMTVHIIAVHLY